MYRTRTLALLLRYMRLSVEVGRLPSLLGREFFRARVSSYHVATFEDTVIFAHDMERTMARLDPFSQRLITKIVLQEYTQAEVAALLGCSWWNIERFYTEALDRLSEEFLRGGLLRAIPGLTPFAPKKVVKRQKSTTISYAVATKAKIFLEKLVGYPPKCDSGFRE